MSKKEKVQQFCTSQQAALEAARKTAGSTKILTKARKEADQQVKAAQKALTECKKQFTKAGGMHYAKALARAAQDTKQPFPLAPDFAKTAKAFQADDAVLKAFKVQKMEDAVLAGKKIAKKMGLEEATQYAATSQALTEAMKGTKAGFITAQVGAAVVDVIGSYVSLGTYAAAAPAVHAALSAGQKVTVALIQKDIDKNEQNYKAAVEKYFSNKELEAQKKEAAKAQKDLTQLESLEKQASTAEAATSDGKPWYTSPGVLIGGGFLIGLTIYAATRKSPRA